MLQPLNLTIRRSISLNYQPQFNRCVFTVFCESVGQSSIQPQKNNNIPNPPKNPSIDDHLPIIKPSNNPTDNCNKYPPYYCLEYRNSDHDVQRQLRQLIKQFITLKNGQPTQQQTLQSLEKGKQQLLTLKRELSEHAIEQTKLYEVCRKRVHCQEEANFHQETKPEQTAQRQQAEMGSEIMQYLLSRGDIEKARHLQAALKEDSQFSSQCDLFQELFQICSQIRENNLLGVRTWANQNLHMLFKLQSNLEFQLTCCEYLNLIRLQQTKGACQCLRINLEGIKLNKQQHAIIQTLTYLLISPIKSTQSLLNKHLQRAQQVFKKAFAQIYCLSLDANLPRKLAIGLSALKSVCCSDQSKRNPEVCPICSDNSQKICRRIPMLTKQGSCLICRVNGSIMDHQNYPIALPSKYIYSSSALASTQVDQQYYCAVTQTYYKKEEARKVYLA